LPLLAAVVLGACDRGAPSAARRPSATRPSSSLESPETMPSARRPSRRYFLAHREGRCEVLVEPAGETSFRPTPCPPDLLVGERIRLAGKTCFREGGDPDRIEPVVCPDPLTDLERHERGEF
jgi:hypothetical protein